MYTHIFLKVIILNFQINSGTKQFGGDNELKLTAVYMLIYLKVKCQKVTTPYNTIKMS